MAMTVPIWGAERGTKPNTELRGPRNGIARVRRAVDLGQHTLNDLSHNFYNVTGKRPEQACTPQMKTDLASTFPILASHLPPEETPGVLQAVPPIIPIIPIGAAKPVFADEVAAMPTQDFDLARDLSLFACVLRRAQGGKLVLAIFVTSIFVTIANMLAQVRLNEWNGQFFDAVGRKDLSAFVHFLWTFVLIIAVLLTLTVAQPELEALLEKGLRDRERQQHGDDEDERPKKVDEGRQVLAADGIEELAVPFVEPHLCEHVGNGHEDRRHEDRQYQLAALRPPQHAREQA